MKILVCKHYVYLKCANDFYDSLYVDIIYPKSGLFGPRESESFRMIPLHQSVQNNVQFKEKQ